MKSAVEHCAYVPFAEAWTWVLAGWVARPPRHRHVQMDAYRVLMWHRCCCGRLPPVPREVEGVAALSVHQTRFAPAPPSVS